jgi:predicted nuclease with TOPRIM domain
MSKKIISRYSNFSAVKPQKPVSILLINISQIFSLLFIHRWSFKQLSQIMKYSVIILIITSIFFNLSQSVTIDCDFEDWGHDGYACKLKNLQLITSKSDREVKKVQGQHLNDKGDDDVKYFYSYGSEINFFPRGLTKHFKNLEKVEIRKANLQEISKNDLMEFGEKLKFLSFESNNLIFIESDLFEFNKNLEFIYLRYCGIRHIEDGSFDKLENLKSLYLSGNPCTSNEDETKEDREKVLKLIENVEKKCKDENSNLRKRTVEKATSGGEFKEATTSSGEIESLATSGGDISSNLGNKPLNLRSSFIGKFQSSSTEYLVTSSGRIGSTATSVYKLQSSTTEAPSSNNFLRPQATSNDENLNSALKLKEQEISAINKNLTTTLNTLRNKNQEIRRLRLKVKDLENLKAEKFENSNSSKLNEENSKYVEEILNKSAEISKLSEELLRKSEEFTKLNEEISKLNEEITKLNEKFASLTEEIFKLNEINSKLNEDLLKKSEEFTKLNKQFSNLNEQFSKLNDEFSQNNEKFSKLNEQHSVQSTETSKLTQENFELKAEIIKLKLENSNLNEKLQDLKERTNLQKLLEQKLENLLNEKQIQDQELIKAKFSYFDSKLEQKFKNLTGEVKREFEGVKNDQNNFQSVQQSNLENVSKFIVENVGEKIQEICKEVEPETTA